MHYHRISTEFRSIGTVTIKVHAACRYLSPYKHCKSLSRDTIVIGLTSVLLVSVMVLLTFNPFDIATLSHSLFVSSNMTWVFLDTYSESVHGLAADFLADRLCFLSPSAAVGGAIIVSSRLKVFSRKYRI